ncbi:MAG: NAD(P)-binding protein, partial [Thermoleophilia bacterium]|nr:NAD(P)-binding protein [Thermoleophilia bacterium]
MADATFDAIVVGGGHHGTIIAAYLAKAGLDTAVFERQHELGGGACGEDLPCPGFVQN